MEILVRKATADDYNSLCELFDEMDTLHRDRLPDIFQKPDGPARTQDYYLGLIADGNVAFLVAETSGTLVGAVHAIIRDMPALPIFVPRRYTMVEGIVVKSEFQHQGIGRILMSRMQEWAVEKDAAAIELNVYEFNESAISFYEKLGFQILSRKMSRDPKQNKPAD